ncbi:esterase, partial [mine drainage metagenome]
MGEIVKIDKTTIHATSLKGNVLGDPVDRDIYFFSHKFNDDSPVLIGLAGFFGSAVSFLNRSFSSQDFIRTLDRICTIHPEISFMIAIPDSMTSLGGNQYINSDAVGNYEDFIIKDVVGKVNHTLGRRKLGIFGKSSGGFGAYNLAVRNPEIFSGFIDVSGDSAFEYCYMKDFPDAIEVFRNTSVDEFLEHFRNSSAHTRQELNALGVAAMAAFYSPTLSAPGKFDLPFDRKTGLVDPLIWERWLDHDPARTVRSSTETLRKKKVILQVGKHDEFSINVGIRSMHESLAETGVPHEFYEYDEGHF